MEINKLLTVLCVLSNDWPFTNCVSKFYRRPSQMVARGPNPACRPYLFGPFSTPIYTEIHDSKMVLIWPLDIYL